MLTIRPEQMDVFADECSREFVVKTVAHVEREYPDAYTERGRERVEQLIRQTIRESQAYGLDTNVDVLALVSLKIIYGDEFPHAPEYASVRDIFSSEIVAANEKIAMVLEELG